MVKIIYEPNVTECNCRDQDVLIIMNDISYSYPDYIWIKKFDAANIYIKKEFEQTFIQLRNRSNVYDFGIKKKHYRITCNDLGVVRFTIRDEDGKKYGVILNRRDIIRSGIIGLSVLMGLIGLSKLISRKK